MLVLDSTGQLENQFGKRGKGPGEVRMPIALGVAQDGTIGVFDLALPSDRLVSKLLKLILALMKRQQLSEYA